MVHLKNLRERIKRLVQINNRSNIFLPQWTYWVLLILLLISITTTLLSSNGSAIQSFGMNLTTELIGILVVLLVVDLAVKISKQHKLAKYRSIAFSRLQKPIIHHARLFTYLLKASVLKKPDKKYINIADLFDEEYFSEIKKLNLSAKAPSIPERIWYQYISQECFKFSESINNTLDKYAIYLDTEISELLEDIYDSRFLGIFLERFPLRRFDGTHWVHLDNIFEGQITPSFSGFFEGQALDFLKEHAEMFVKLVDVYNDSVPLHKSIKFDNKLWSDTIAPAIGSGRVPPRN